MKYSVSVYNRYRKPILTDVKVDTWEEALVVIKDTLNNAPFVIQEIGESEGVENLKASDRVSDYAIRNATRRKEEIRANYNLFLPK